MTIFRGSPAYFSSTGIVVEFVYLMFTLPFKCNFRCPKCFNLENNKPNLNGSFITLQDIFSKIEDAKELCGKAVVIAGEGEPSLHTNIKEIVQKINSLQMIPIVYSNASTLSTDIIQFYKENNASLVIALDSLLENRYSLLTNTKNMLPKVLKNIKQVKELYSDTIKIQNNNNIVRIAINTTVSTLNVDEVKVIKDFCGDDFYFVCNPLAMHGNALNNWNKLNPNFTDIEDYSFLIKELSESGGPLTLDASGICAYSKNGISINPYGDYMTCAYTNKTNGLFKNIHNQSLEEAYKKKSFFENKFYSEKGATPCLIRHKEFQNYINGIREENKIEVEY